MKDYLGFPYIGGKISRIQNVHVESQRYIDSKNILVAYVSHGTFLRAFSYSRDIFSSKSAEDLKGETQEN